MHHKRNRPANRRAGCKLCKPWKANGYATEREGGEKHSDHRRRIACTGRLPEEHTDAGGSAETRAIPRNRLAKQL